MLRPLAHSHTFTTGLKPRVLVYLGFVLLEDLIVYLQITGRTPRLWS